MSDIELGMRVQDFITGFQGIAIARIDHLFGSPEIKIQPMTVDENGRPADPVWFKESRVRIAAVHESLARPFVREEKKNE